jgi:hypothetical protein
MAVGYNHTLRHDIASKHHRHHGKHHGRERCVHEIAPEKVNKRSSGLKNKARFPSMWLDDTASFLQFQSKRNNCPGGVTSVTTACQ